MRHTENSNIITVTWATKNLLLDTLGRDVGVIGVIDNNFKNGLNEQFLKLQKEV
jgi:hypothetical protein